VDNARNRNAVACEELAEPLYVSPPFPGEGTRGVGLAWCGVAVLDKVELHGTSTIRRSIGIDLVTVACPSRAQPSSFLPVGDRRLSVKDVL
jgi:hypothetical protein